VEEIRDLLLRTGDLATVSGVRDVYIVETSYANLLEISEEQIIQEANPWAVFGFLTAMVHHELTDLAPREVHALQFDKSEHQQRTPLGTSPENWIGLTAPSAREPEDDG